MRAKFNVKIPAASDGTFPSDIDLIKKIRSYGWETNETHNLSSEADKLVAYKRLAVEQWESKHIPEVLRPELEETIFYGVIRSDQTIFFVTRTQGEMVYRLIHPQLPTLISSTRKILLAIAAGDGAQNGRPHNIIDNRILIFERALDFVVVEGRLVDSPLSETFRANPKDVLVMVGVLVFIVLDSLTYFGLNLPFLSNQTFEKITISAAALSLVSLLGLATTFIGIRRSKLVAWKGLE